METVTRGKMIYKGKANTLYETNVQNLLEMESTDRISSGNGKRKSVVEGKGLTNNTISTLLFTLFEKNDIPTHYVSNGSTPYSKIIRKAKMIKLEVIGRFISAGSFCERYNIEKGKVFDNMIFELTYKDDSLGDPLISESAAIGIGIVTLDQIEDIKDYTYAIGDCAQEFFKNFGLTLVDFKVEFGIDVSTGELILCDEFSPDTCRLWDENGNSFDKDVFRKDLDNTTEIYKKILDIIKSK